MSLYLVMSLKKEHEAVLEVGPDRRQITVPVKIEWADGMVGALPVFDNQKDAEAYANGRYQVLKMAEVGTGTEEVTDAGK